MDSNTAVILFILILAISVTICNYHNNKYPTTSTPTNKFDAINDELKRCHRDIQDYDKAPDWYKVEIARLNKALVEDKNET